MAATVCNEDFTNLQLLLKAPSKDAVREVCVQSQRGLSQRLTESTAATLGISEAQAAQSLHALSHYVLFYNLSSPEQILAIFPESFHSSLKNLITKILLENSATWRTEALSNQTDSESVSSVTVELSRESLDTILDGLGRIRDQLSVVAGK
uniref:COMM domain containing 9 n=1 Tax=Pundamilia nyererei TaxID=303518 RepID=A0A3B4GNK0_9CICH